MKIIVDHIPLNTAFKRRPGIKRVPKTITIHSTGNPTSTAKGERSWLTNPTNKRQASYNYAVDDTNIIEVLPPDEVAWHAGDGRGQGNMYSIGIEICESGDREKAIANAVWLVQHLQTRFKLQSVPLKRHYDWSKKICPRIFYDGGKWTGWAKFVAQCKADSTVSSFKVRKDDEFTMEDFKGIGLAAIKVDELSLRSEPSVSGKLIKTLPVNGLYNIYGEKDGWLNLGGGWASNVGGKYIQVINKPIPKPVVKPVVKEDTGTYKVQVFAGSKTGAEEVAAELKKKGFPALVYKD